MRPRQLVLCALLLAAGALPAGASEILSGIVLADGSDVPGDVLFVIEKAADDAYRAATPTAAGECTVEFKLSKWATQRLMLAAQNALLTPYPSKKKNKKKKGKKGKAKGKPKDPAKEPKDPAKEPKDPAKEPKDPAKEPKDPAKEPK